MRASRAIKLTLFLGSFALSLSQIPRMLEMVEGVRTGGPVGAAGGLSGMGRAFDMLGELQSNKLGAGGQTGDAPPGLRVFSPEGGRLTDAQRAELLAAAERLRPRIVRRETGADSGSSDPSSNAEDEGSAGADAGRGGATISNLDPEMLEQLETLKGAEEALKALTNVEKDKDE